MNELRRIDLNLLPTLYALLTEGHVTRAAIRLNKSQPAVSHALAQLRGHFGDPLLVRQRGNMILTNKALQLLEPLEKALSGIHTLLETPEFDPSSYKGLIRLSLSDYASGIILPHLTRILRSTAPGIDLGISQASRDTALSQLRDGEVDLAFGIFPVCPEDINRENLFEDHFVSIIDSSERLPSEPLSLKEWFSRPHVMVALRPDAQDEIEQVLLDQNYHRRLMLVMPHWSAAVATIAGTDLILTIARRSIRDLSLYPSLRIFEPPLQLPSLQYQQVWHERRHRDPMLSWLRNIVKTSCASIASTAFCTSNGV
ncbi:LysR family transcriptional regulator [Gluconobacter cerevisiae]|uniref:LysR family transcriptional regulator n=1 Tax=Gluconobacter cerevisiae TaxID=1379734 RepID=A0ABR9YET6_9PROT|nr:LysR family transcriptional regulator [Gluconobacter cerevisiae]MBF0877164.1 LysR family transcriptional regulator [Gluconobacter cerevisiae]